MGHHATVSETTQSFTHFPIPVMVACKLSRHSDQIAPLQQVHSGHGRRGFKLGCTRIDKSADVRRHRLRLIPTPNGAPWSRAVSSPAGIRSHVFGKGVILEEDKRPMLSTGVVLGLRYAATLPAAPVRMVSDC